MATLAGLRREEDRTFVLDEAKLRRIVDVLAAHAQKVGYATHINYHIGRADDAFFDTSSIEDVLADDNSGRKRIDHLVVELHRTTDKPEAPHFTEHRPRPIAYVGFFMSGRHAVVKAVMEANRDWCFLVSDELDVQIDRTLGSKYYKYLRSRAFDFTVVLLLLAASALVGWALLKSGAQAYSSAEIAAMSPDQRTTKILEMLVAREKILSISLPAVSAILVVAGLLTQLTPLSRIAKWLDRSVFYWGDMAGEHDEFTALMGRVKWGLWIALSVSVVAGLIVAGILRTR